MKISNQLRSFLGRYQLQNDQRKFEVAHETVGFDEASRIGILYDATEEKDFEFIKEWIKRTRTETKKDILAMGFVNKKQLPSRQFPQYGMDFFTKKDLDFKMVPTDPIVMNFINERYDILINLHTGNCFPLQYIATLSKSRFRVGIYNKKHITPYELMTNLKGNPGIKEALEETVLFLKKIK